MNEIQVKPNRLLYLIPIPFILPLIAVAYWAAFVKEDSNNGVFAIAIFIFVIGGFLLIRFVKSFLDDPVIMLVNEQGFEYNPAGYSTGFILWTDVEKVDEVTVTTNTTRVMDQQIALGVWMKDPELYYQRWNIAIRKLMQINQKMYGATILIQPSSLGKDYERVRQALLEKRLPHSV